MSEELKGLTMGAIMWAVIAGNYAITGIAFKILYESQHETAHEMRETSLQVHQAMVNATTDREKRFQEMEREAREGTEQRADQISAFLREMQVRLNDLSAQQAEMRADLRNLKDLKEDLKTLLAKKR